MSNRYLASLLCAAAFSVFTVTASTVQAQAQAAVAPGGPALTPAQQARTQARMQQFNADVTALRTNTKMTPAQKQAKFQAMRTALDKDMLAVLTPAQRAAVAKQRASAMNFQKAHAAEIKQGQAIAAQLNASVTPAEKTQLAAVAQAARTQLTQINADTTLTPQAKQAKERAIAQDADAKSLAILTPAQQASYRKMQQMRQKLVSEAAQTSK